MLKCLVCQYLILSPPLGQNMQRVPPSNAPISSELNASQQNVYTETWILNLTLHLLSTELKESSF